MRIALLTGVLLPFAAACASPSAPPPVRTPFADALIARAAVPSESRATAPMPGRSVVLPATAADPLDGLVAIDADRRAALAGAPIDTVLAAGVTPGDLAYLAATRSPAVAAARERLAAARTRIAQSRDLAELVGAVAVVGSAAARRRGHDGPAARADDRSPGIDALSAEIAQQGVAIAHEDVHASVRDAVVTAARLHADVEHLYGLRELLAAELEVFDALLDVLRARQEAGRVGDAAVASMSARRARVRTDLAATVDRERALAGRWNALVARRAETAASLMPRPVDLPDGADPAAVERAALGADPRVRAARLRVVRSDLALRLAETMTAGPADARPQDVRSPPLSFGVRAAQLDELRARAAASRQELAGAEDAVAANVRAAMAAYDEAGRMHALHRDETVPLAERARDAVRASFEAGRVTTADLLIAFDDVLAARRALLAARRDSLHAHAELIRAAGYEPLNGGLR